MNWQNHPSDIFLNQGRLVGRIRAVEGRAKVGGDCTLKGGGKEKKGGETKC